MIKKQFKNPIKYYFVRFLGFVFIAFFSTLMLAPFALAIIYFTNIFSLEEDSYKGLFIISFFLFIFIYLFWKYFIEKYFNKSLIKNIKNDKILSKDEFFLVKGEQIYVEKFPCLIKRFSIGSSVMARNVVVTNYRITIGFLNSLSILSKKRKMEEIMGLLNIWHPKISEIPKLKIKDSLKKLHDAIGGSTKIKDISYGKDSQGSFFIIHPKYLIPHYYKIYHPKSKEIYLYFKENL